MGMTKQEANGTFICPKKHPTQKTCSEIQRKKKGKKRGGKRKRMGRKKENRDIQQPLFSGTLTHSPNFFLLLWVLRFWFWNGSLGVVYFGLKWRVRNLWFWTFGPLSVCLFSVYAFFYTFFYWSILASCHSIDTSSWKY